MNDNLVFVSKLQSDAPLSFIGSGGLAGTSNVEEFSCQFNYGGASNREYAWIHQSSEIQLSIQWQLRSIWNIEFSIKGEYFSLKWTCLHETPWFEYLCISLTSNVHFPKGRPQIWMNFGNTQWFPKKAQHNFLKRGRGGQRPFGVFSSENSFKFKASLTSNVYLPNLAKAIVMVQPRIHLIMLLQLFCIKTSPR